jgi:hypothetical protein
METTFYILLSMRTSKGPESFGRFYIGNNRKRATEIFMRMEGSTDTKEEDILFMELMESRNGLPANLKIKTCTLEQISRNCKILIKDIFMIFNTATK